MLNAEASMKFARFLLICGLMFGGANLANAQILDAPPKPDNCTPEESASNVIRSDKVHCIVQSSKNVTKPRSRCGKSDSGRALDAEVLVQHLRYESWRNGKQISTWYDNREILIRCIKD